MLCKRLFCRQHSPSVSTDTAGYASGGMLLTAAHHSSVPFFLLGKAVASDTATRGEGLLSVTGLTKDQKFSLGTDPSLATIGTKSKSGCIRGNPI